MARLTFDLWFCPNSGLVAGLVFEPRFWVVADDHHGLLLLSYLLSDRLWRSRFLVV